MSVRKRVKLLVVDDHPRDFEQLCDTAEMYNSNFAVECKLAVTEKQAMEMLRSWQPSVVLLDIYLADTHALELIRQISEAGAPVIATSAVRIPELTETVKEYGAAGYISKSDNPDELEAILEFVAAVSVPCEQSH